MVRFVSAQGVSVAGEKPATGSVRSVPSPLGRAVRALVGILTLVGVLSCGSAPVSTKNPSTLWVNFGQTELDLILVESEPPYY